MHDLKVTLRHANPDGSPKPLLVKSPVHTARMRLFHAMFPRARFLYIHRHPVQARCRASQAVVLVQAKHACEPEFSFVLWLTAMVSKVPKWCRKMQDGTCKQYPAATHTCLQSSSVIPPLPLP